MKKAMISVTVHWVAHGRRAVLSCMVLGGTSLYSCDYLLRVTALALCVSVLVSFVAPVWGQWYCASV